MSGNSQLNRLTPVGRTIRSPTRQARARSTFATRIPGAGPDPPAPLPRGSGAGVTVRHGQEKLYSHYSSRSTGWSRICWCWCRPDDPDQVGLPQRAGSLGAPAPSSGLATFYAEWVLGSFARKRPNAQVDAATCDAESGSRTGAQRLGGRLCRLDRVRGPLGARPHSFTADRARVPGPPRFDRRHRPPSDVLAYRVAAAGQGTPAQRGGCTASPWKRSWVSVRPATLCDSSPASHAVGQDTRLPTATGRRRIEAVWKPRPAPAAACGRSRWTGRPRRAALCRCATMAASMKCASSSVVRLCEPTSNQIFRVVSAQPAGG